MLPNKRVCSRNLLKSNNKYKWVQFFPAVVDKTSRNYPPYSPMKKIHSGTKIN